MILKCKICGGDIEATEDKSFGTCLYCGCAMTFPKLDDEQRAVMFNRGNQYRRMGEFDRAVSVYEQILQEDNTDAEAHWCCALSRFGIEYVEDPNTYEWIPTCHRLSFDSFLEDADYLAALEYSDGIEKKQYVKDAFKIVEVQKGILCTAQNEAPFDVFICYKESSDSGDRTVDSVLAQDIYYQLTEEGYRVFYSKITLEDKAGSEFEPYIFAALNSAKVMVVVGTKKEYLESVWVKNEWSRYLAIMRKNRDRVILPCYKDMDPYDMPEALSVLQSYDMSKIGFIQDLIRGIGKIVDRDGGKDAQSHVKEGMTADTIEPLLKRVLLFLEDGDFVKADNFCETVLNTDPENAKAYLYKVMASEGIKDENVLFRLGKKIQDDRNFTKAVRFADQEEKERLEKIIKDAIAYDNENIYVYACDISKSEDDLKKICEACSLFKELSGYRDSEAKMYDLESRIISPQYNAAIAKYDSAETYSDMKEVSQVFETISLCHPDAQEYIHKINECYVSWRDVLCRMVEDKDRYKNAKEFVNMMKKSCPALFENSKHEEFVKELEKHVYIEKFYGSTKETVLKCVRDYCSFE